MLEVELSGRLDFSVGCLALDVRDGDDAVLNGDLPLAVIGVQFDRRHIDLSSSRLKPDVVMKALGCRIGANAAIDSGVSLDFDLLPDFLRDKGQSCERGRCEMDIRSLECCRASVGFSVERAVNRPMAPRGIDHATRHHELLVLIMNVTMYAR